MPPTIPQDYLTILSLFVAALSNYLRDAGLSKTTNAIISLVAILLIGAATVWITTGFTSNLQADIILACSTLVSLFAGVKELNDLLNFLNTVRSPIAPRGPAILTARASRNEK
jgi:hypothetical protein